MSASFQHVSRWHRNLWLHYFALVTAGMTFPLIFMGGLVTSHSAALAVPDWPTSYGYNMFLFPWHKMVGGIFYEHSHRLIASLVGFLTMILAIWLWLEEPRRWLKWLGWIALALVVFQGVLGGLRVVLLKQPIAIFHACLAQFFFCFVSAIALFTSPWWKRLGDAFPKRPDGMFRKLVLGTTVLIFIQLIFGATMRHTNSGLAVPDFPWIYGKIFPPLNSTALEQLNQERIWQWNMEPISFQQLAVHLAHRVGAVIIALAVFAMLWVVRRSHWECKELRFFVLGLTGLVILQMALGVFVIWTEKAADIATAHVAVGALTLVTSVLLTLISFKLFVSQARHIPSLSLTNRLIANLAAHERVVL